jgi:hypothetical protein
MVIKKIKFIPRCATVLTPSPLSPKKEKDNSGESSGNQTSSLSALEVFQNSAPDVSQKIHSSLGDPRSTIKKKKKKTTTTESKKKEVEDDKKKKKSKKKSTKSTSRSSSKDKTRRRSLSEPRDEIENICLAAAMLIESHSHHASNRRRGSFDDDDDDAEETSMGGFDTPSDKEDEEEEDDDDDDDEEEKDFHASFSGRDKEKSKPSSRGRTTDKALPAASSGGILGRIARSLSPGTRRKQKHKTLAATTTTTTATTTAGDDGAGKHRLVKKKEKAKTVKPRLGKKQQSTDSLLEDLLNADHEKDLTSEQRAQLKKLQNSMGDMRFDFDDTDDHDDVNYLLDVSGGDDNDDDADNGDY